MEVIIEKILFYGVSFLLIGAVVFYYLRNLAKKSKLTEKKVAVAKEEGLFEPVSLHPYIDLSACIGSGACITACPEKDILGIVNNKATVIHASNCIGHGACFHACPVEAISLRIGTEKRGVDLPHVNETFETNIRGIYIAGELGGMGLIKNSVEQGCQAMENIIQEIKKSVEGVYDVVIIGAGPAGIAGSLKAKENGLHCVTLEQDSIGGTVYSFPRSKIVMTSPMDLPLFGKVKLFDTSKEALLDIWNEVISKNGLDVRENSKVEHIVPLDNDLFKVVASDGEEYITQSVLIAIGRRGSPRKLGVKGEDLPKVAYRLLEPERIEGLDILVVGGGDSAVESAFLLMKQNKVILSYRKDKFSRLKPKNKEILEEASRSGSLEVITNSEVEQISEHYITLKLTDDNVTKRFNNDLVYIFAGGELPVQFLKSVGIEISKRFGYIMKSHKSNR